MLLNLPLAGLIMEKVARAVELPVSVKIRIGYHNGENVAVELARIAAQSGICAITVHGRTKDQGYAGQAEWDNGRCGQSIGGTTHDCHWQRRCQG